MSYIERSALVNYPAQKMFVLVNDIDSYPEFMTGCVGAEVLAKGEDWLEARLDLSKGGFTHSLVTKNTLVEPHSMDMYLVSGPFKKFSGQWRFLELSEFACKVSFSLDYEFSSKVLGAMLRGVFESVASEQVQCLCERARQVYS